MLDHILRAFANFERTHQMAANVLDISHEHFQSLVEEYPRIFGQRAEVELGFHICLHENRDQRHPSVRKMGAWYEASAEQRKRAKQLERLQYLQA